MNGQYFSYMRGVENERNNKIPDLHNHKGTDGEIYHDPTAAQYRLFGMNAAH